MDRPKNLTIPLKLDAFVLNEQVSSGGEKDSKIAPITQPNYTFLQLKDGLIQHDILDHVDLHNATPAKSNSRLYDLGQATLRRNRVGVYLHWTLPRVYRTGSGATPSGAKQHTERRQAKGLSTSSNPEEDYASPEFRPLPNRWLVIRTLDPNADTTEPKGTSINPVDAWVVESDRLLSIDDDDLDDADLQVDISPYITTNKQSVGKINLEEQAESFIGLKTPAASWTRDQDITGPDTSQRVDLTAVSSSNQIFLDYQPHCSNVFSIVDTFAYDEDKSLTKATANYYVIGWHKDPSQGPFGDLKPDGTTSRGDRLDALALALGGKDEGFKDDIKEWLDSKDQAQVLCHGAMYKVAWDDSKWPTNVPANEASHTLLDLMPVAVGTTPIDSLLAYIDSHQHNDSETDDEKKLEKDLHCLAPLLRAQDEGVDAQRAAMDEVQNWNFARESGGKHWYFQSQEGKPPQEPPNDQAEAIEQLNQAQRARDGAAREIVQLQWAMFSYWWRYVSAVNREKTYFPVDKLKEQVGRFRDIVTQQDDLIERLLQDKKSFPVPPQAGVLPEFNQPRDPTLLVAGIRAGWPDDFLDDLRVRLDNQLVPPEEKVDTTPYCIEKLPDTLQSTAEALIQEFIALGKEETEAPTGDPRLPLYHDHGNHGDSTDPLRDQWGDTQPWAPLFLEWQAEYFHIPWESWAMSGERKDQLDTNWRLGIKPEVDLQKLNIQDTRPLSGRILLLPQPNFSLQAAIDQLFNSVDPEILNKYLDEEQQKEVKTMTYKLPFLSAPLDGFTDHLLTLVHGTHIKPNVRYPTGAGYPQEGLHPIGNAVVGDFDEAALGIIDISSELTPYGALLVHSTNDDGDDGGSNEKKPHPFKPVTHGQFRFSKLNIIDKFGQSICAIDPRYGHEDEQAVFPHLSAYYEPQLLNQEPNLVRPPRAGCEGHCEFSQVPPTVNQPSRLNSTFVTHDSQYLNQYAYWRPVTEWENPIWGWMVLNYVDYGIQIFLQDGTFYREVRLASPDAPKHTSKSAEWLPFAPPPDRPHTEQLDHLISRLTEQDQKFLHDFLRMANDFLTLASPAPSAYASFLNSLVGRPLALVNAGWSLELATEATTNHADLDLDTEPDPPIKLTGGRNDNIYDFPVKFGDITRANDGLVGYFDVKETKTAGDELDLTKIYTYYSKGGIPDGGNLEYVSTANVPKLSAFWLNPTDYNEGTATPSERAKAYTQAWNDKLHVVGCIIDPFLPITAYSSILPINNLRLSNWMWEKALQKMTAFFHLGPIVITNDVEKYRREGKVLSGDYNLGNEQEYTTLKEQAVGMPALQTGNWAWLQPYLAGNGTDGQAEYKPLGLGRVDGKPKFQSGPYTAIEGYLQLREPIVREE
ncbi:hypothetical protein K449DRAFT_443531 [Hypoxylon sp. EC38]|nr:hypothetical protein K449DRAFT_443531 [Hypoxylon sp. EC38]